MTLGQKIKKLRTDKGLTQKELSDQVFVTFQTVSKWEKDENEPDVSTLRLLAKVFGCSLDYLLNENEEVKEEKKEEVVVTPTPTIVETKTVIVHQKELHVCEHCHKDIPEDDLAMEDICVRHGGRGHSAEYRKAFYHRSCFEQVKRDREAAKLRARKAHRAKSKKLSFGWGIAGGVVALGVSLGCLLAIPACQAAIHPGLAVLYSVLIGYAIFADLYCIISGSFIGDVFLGVSGWSIKMPGVIFSWDIEGIAWAIAMKIFLAILGFTLGVMILGLAVAISAGLAAISFPFILIHNIRTDYEDGF